MTNSIVKDNITIEPKYFGYYDTSEKTIVDYLKEEYLEGYYYEGLHNDILQQLGVLSTFLASHRDLTLKDASQIAQDFMWILREGITLRIDEVEDFASYIIQAIESKITPRIVINRIEEIKNNLSKNPDVIRNLLEYVFSSRVSEKNKVQTFITCSLSLFDNIKATY